MRALPISLHRALYVLADLEVVPRGTGVSALHASRFTNVQNLGSRLLIVNGNRVFTSIDRRDSPHELTFIGGGFLHGVRSLSGLTIGRHSRPYMIVGGRRVAGTKRRYSRHHHKGQEYTESGIGSRGRFGPRSSDRWGSIERDGE